VPVHLDEVVWDDRLHIAEVRRNHVAERQVATVNGRHLPELRSSKAPAPQARLVEGSDRSVQASRTEEGVAINRHC
jgi:hypothetical protein